MSRTISRKDWKQFVNEYWNEKEFSELTVKGILKYFKNYLPVSIPEKFTNKTKMTKWFNEMKTFVEPKDGKQPNALEQISDMILHPKIMTNVSVPGNFDASIVYDFRKCGKFTISSILTKPMTIGQITAELIGFAQDKKLIVKVKPKTIKENTSERILGASERKEKDEPKLINGSSESLKAIAEKLNAGSKKESVTIDRGKNKQGVRLKETIVVHSSEELEAATSKNRKKHK